MQTQVMIAVKDVQASSAFYQALLGATSGHGGDEFEMIMFEDRQLLQLHHQDPDEHTGMLRPGEPLGNGVLIWFVTEQFDDVVARARQMALTFLEQPTVNELARHRECIVQDPDGYSIAIATFYGDC